MTSEEAVWLKKAERERDIARAERDALRAAIASAVEPVGGEPWMREYVLVPRAALAKQGGA